MRQKNWNLLLASLCLSISGLAQMTGVVVEVDTAFYEPTNFDLGYPIYSELEGYVTYSVYAEFTNPTDELSAIYADEIVLGTEPFYIDAPCGCFNPQLGDVLLGGTQNPALFDFFPEVAYDTYWTLGYAVGEQYTGINPLYSSTVMCSEQEDGGTVFTVMPEAAGDDLRIKFAQVTTCGDFEMHACLQVFPMSDQGASQQWCMEGDGDGPITIQNPCEQFANSDATVTVTSDINCFGDLASTEVNVNGAAPITYELFNAADTTLISTQVGNNEFSDLPQGDYFVAIMDGNTCRDSTEMFSFVEPPQLEASWELLQDNSCGELTSVIEMEFSGGTPEYQSIAYSTTPYANVTYHLQPNNQFVGVPCWYGNGDWIFEIVDANGCSVDTLITLTCTEPPEFYDCAGACILDTDGDGICDELEIPGCTADIAQNFDPLATDDDGSCIIPGCTIEIACNYDPLATVDDNSCEFYCPGCTIENACNYDPDAIQDDGSCEFPAFAYGCDGECLQDTDGDMVCDELEIYGCTIVPACNYDAEATENDGSCFFGIAPGYDCDGNCIYDSDGDGVCDEFEVAGCQDDTACNFDPAATDANGSCEYPENYYQCDGSCINDSDYDGVCDELEEPGCTSVEACNFDADATDNDGSCVFPDVGYDCQGECLLDTDGDSICDEFEIPGCMDEAACNFALEATDEDGSCEFETCAGCTYEYACNFDPLATIADNTTCEFGTCPGCTDQLACNFNPTVTEDDGSCDFTSCVGCMDLDACNYNSLATTDDGSCEYISCTIPGCTDPEACNFDAEAGYDDGSCLTTDICGVCGGTGIAPGACDCEGNTPALGFDCDGNCLSDLNENGICDVLELVSLQNEIDSLQSQIYGGTYCGPGTTWDNESGECISSDSCPQDLDGDGIIGVDDLLLLLGAYGTACEAPNVEWICGDPVNYQGYDYSTVQIGEQCWFAENLRTEQYANGDHIPSPLNSDEWNSTNLGATAVYGNQTTGTLIIYLSSNSEEGWGGNSIIVSINDEIIGELSAEGAFAQFDFEISELDEIQLEYVEVDSLFTPLLSVSVYNCGFLNATQLTDLTPGVILATNSECDFGVTDNLNNYGRLYNWYSIEDERGLCPNGWHVPSDDEFKILEMTLGMSEIDANSTGWDRGTDEGSQLKASASDLPSWNGSNTSGFLGLSGGQRYGGGSYGDDQYGLWWSGTDNEGNAWNRILSVYHQTVKRDLAPHNHGFSIRCIKDEE